MGVDDSPVVVVVDSPEELKLGISNAACPRVEVLS